MNKRRAVSNQYDRGQCRDNWQDIIARANLQTEGAIKVFVQITRMGVNEGAALKYEENEREGEREVLGSPSLQHVLPGFIQSHGVICLQGALQSC